MRPLFLGVFLLAGACAPLSAGEPPHPAGPPPQPAFHEWQVWDVREGRPVALEPWLAGLASARVIYVGEEHRNRWHVEAALKILRALIAHNLRPAVAMEMFGWDGQEALDRYLSDAPPPRDRFLEEVLWEESWGGPFEDYEPLVDFARDHRLPLLALNPPRVLVRLVAMQGLRQARQDDRMARWGMRDEPLQDDEGYHSIVLDQLKRCHAKLSDDAYQRMYDASLFREEGMAKIVADQLRGNHASAGAGPVLVYTGGGHIQYRVPVPNRVARRLGPEQTGRQVTVYLAAYEPNRPEAIQDMLRDPIADYLWLTPLSAHGPPRRCK
jgi:uncharacterized iron-regulated protein